MSSAFLTAGQIWLIGLLFVVGVLIVRGRSSAQRVLALDTASLLLIGVLVLFSFERGSPYVLDAALVLGLLGFVSTLRLARNLREEDQPR